MWIKDFLKKYKYSIIGICGMLCVIIFTSSVLSMYKEDYDNDNLKDRQALELLNKDLKDRELKAIQEREEIKLKNIEISLKVSKLEGKTDEQTKALNQFQDTYIKNTNQLKELKNEKTHIPDNVPISAQAKLLAEYEYKPF